MNHIICGNTGLVKLFGATVFIFFLIAGCLGGRSELPAITSFIIEYPPPSVKSTPVIDAAITVSRFTAADLYSQKEMIYREGPYTRSAYNNHRWEISPSGMISELIYRDLAQTELFSAVRSDISYEKSRFLLEGHVMEFLEVRGEKERYALVAVSATLSDRMAEKPEGRVLFQRMYRIRMPFAEYTPAGFAGAMSKAVEELSMNIMHDVQKAIIES
ncbi:MAG: PqiC family protein [Syntrophales bacterium]|jgi:ABC-type uncharacterized transport system auxiliary subunit|nr:PqiC family protein [Syntrophales bacterium]MDY0043139.1 ABC-type transport auxiliary lipoprotein family protein [Syntrophales bacterium]